MPPAPVNPLPPNKEVSPPADPLPPLTFIMPPLPVAERDSPDCSVTSAPTVPLLRPALIVSSPAEPTPLLPDDIITCPEPPDTDDPLATDKSPDGNSPDALNVFSSSDSPETDITPPAPELMETEPPSGLDPAATMTSPACPVALLP
ncbi:hypothetical protein B484DRAFT_355989, partial [Ochromonadaceae sp. CCMP2298]